MEETLKHGLVPPVVMEFPGITAGGGHSGTSGESSSFKHGFFDRTLNKVEMVLANGEVITASESSNGDLLRGAAGAVGTLGVTTMVEIQLREASKFVETTYHPVYGMEEAIGKLLDFTSKPDEFDYIDGIMFSKTSGAIITGRMTNTLGKELHVQRFSDAKDPWFYLHVKDRIVKHSGPVSEAVPLPGKLIADNPFLRYLHDYDSIPKTYMGYLLTPGQTTSSATTEAAFGLAKSRSTTSQEYLSTVSLAGSWTTFYTPACYIKRSMPAVNSNKWSSRTSHSLMLMRPNLSHAWTICSTYGHCGFVHSSRAHVQPCIRI